MRDSIKKGFPLGCQVYSLCTKGDVLKGFSGKVYAINQRVENGRVITYYLVRFPTVHGHLVASYSVDELKRWGK